jgi:pyruvate-formate lyase-activating enzyme
VVRLLFADDSGRMYDHPSLLCAGASFNRLIPSEAAERCIPLPEGTQLVRLPGRLPCGFHPDSGRLITLRSVQLAEGRVTPSAVAAVLPPGYLRLLLPAARTGTDAPPLPLRAYTAVGLRGERLVAAAFRLDRHTHWDPGRFSRTDWERRIARLTARFPRNKLLRQLAHCTRAYFCCTARNFFLGTYEAALPVSPRCNARCLGCISHQEGEMCSPQDRLSAPPKVKDIVALALYHLRRANPAMVSFGQGCEGEPLLESERIAEAIRKIRKQTHRGTIHMNTNGSRPEALPMLAAAGLNSVRVSLFSARKASFAAYHRGDFTLATVERFVAEAVTLGLYVSLNLLTFPGFTDSQGELDALLLLLRRTRAQGVQLRNLDVDPEWLCNEIQPAVGRTLGLYRFVQALRSELPSLRIGSFNPFREEFAAKSRR